MAKTMPKFHVQNMQKNFGLQIVLNDLNLEFHSHQSIVVDAGSGDEKSVILECLFGNYKPENCSITIDVNKTIWVNNCQRDQIIDGFGMLFQGADLFDRRLVWETMVFGLLTRDPGHKKASETGINEPGQVGLGPDVVDRYPRELLDTMKKHAGLVRTFATNPGIVFFDEPTTGLDPITGDITNNPVVKCLEKSGATVDAAKKGIREVDFAQEGIHDSSIYDGALLEPGMEFTGPAIIEDSGSTTVVHPGNYVHIDSYGNVHINLRDN